MNLLLAFLIVAGNPSSASDTDPADVMFHCGFEADTDRNFDLWPDGWTRRQGIGYPHFVGVHLQEAPCPEGKSCLRIDLDGGGVGAYSGDVVIPSSHSFVLSGHVKTKGLRNNEVFITITFLDAQRKPLGQHRSRSLRGENDWTKIRIGPLTPSDSEVRYARIGLHMEPVGAADLTGSVSFDSILLSRMPRIVLKTNQDLGIYRQLGEAEITCQVSGFREESPTLVFELLDVFGKRVGPLHRQPIVSRQVRKTTDGSTAIADVRWRPPIKEHGFYRVRVFLAGQYESLVRPDIAVLVLPPQVPPKQGEFGWSLPEGETPLRLSQLAPLLGEVGINWVKFPVWQGEEQLRNLDTLAWFSERMSSLRIEIVGMLHAPPEEVRRHFGEQTRIPAADLFSLEPKKWYPSLEPVLTRLALNVRWWQLGRDDVVSFVGHSDLETQIAGVQRTLGQLGQDVRLAIGWGWLFQAPRGSNQPPWRALALSTDPPLTAAELGAYLAHIPKSNVGRWVGISPLPRDQYPLEARGADLVNRMVVAKALGAEAIFAPNPFDPQRGLMQADGTPSELLLPWRTVAGALAGAEYLGHIRLPSGSQNHVFSRDGKALMVVWNDRPTREVLYLGDHVQETDIWGRTRNPRTEEGRQVIEDGSLPTIILGCDDAIMRTRVDLRLARALLPSEHGKQHNNALRIRNFFGQTASGAVRLDGPRRWSIAPRRIEFDLPPGEESELPFSVRFGFDSTTGRYPMRFDFDLMTDRRRQFTVYRELAVGLPDVELEVKTRLDEEGNLVVEQKLTNEGQQPVSFYFDLFAPGRRRQLARVRKLKDGMVQQTYIFPDGEQLIGKTLWLRAEEIGGRRFINHRFVANP